MADLTIGSIRKHIKRIAIPVMVGFFFNTMYNVVDTYYAGLISTQAQAALSISFPVFFLIIAIGSGISTAGTALISNAIGKKSGYKEYTSQIVSFALILSVVLTILGLTLSPLMFEFLGAQSDYLELSLSYMNIIFMGSVFFSLSQAFNSILNSIGQTKPFRNALVAGFFLNLILDPWFMFGGLGLPAMGIKGIALATVVIQAGVAFYLLCNVIGSKMLGTDFVPRLKYYKEIFWQAAPQSLNMLTVAAGIFVITYFASWYGQAAVAAYGIATRIEQIALLPTIGLNVAVLALVGQNNGAKKLSRLKRSLNYALKYAIAVLTIGYAIVFFTSSGLMKLFNQSPQVVSIGSEYLKIAAFISWAYAILFLNVSALQAMKKPVFALYIGVFRQVVAQVGLIWLLTRFIGIHGIWYGVLLSTWLSALITLWYRRRVFARLVDDEN